MNKSRHQGGYALRWVGRTAVSRKRLLLLRECLEYALEGRRRIKEQLKRIGGMEFYDVHLSYIDLETNEEKIIRVKEQGGDSLIPDDPLNPGSLYTVGRGSSGHLGLYRLETQVTAGNGQLKLSGFSSNTGARESVNVGFDYFRANASRIQASLKVRTCKNINPHFYN